VPRSRFEQRSLCDRKNTFLLLRKYLTAATNNYPFCVFTLTKLPGIHTHTAIGIMVLPNKQSKYRQGQEFLLFRFFCL
jgi:hypothetical protein